MLDKLISICKEAPGVNALQFSCICHTQTLIYYVNDNDAHIIYPKSYNVFLSTRPYNWDTKYGAVLPSVGD